MEATTLEQAAESLLSTPDAPQTAEGDNLSEAVDDITEPSDDGQSEEIEIQAESEDDVDASDDDFDYDAEIDDEDQVEAGAQDTDVHTVKVDGKFEQRTLEELKQAYAGQSTIGKRFQEVAELRKQSEQQAAEMQQHHDQQVAALQQQQQQFLQVMQNVQSGGMQPPVQPSKELLANDPIGYVEAKAEYDERKAAFDQNQYAMQQMAEQENQRNAQAHQSYLQGQMEQLQQSIPEFADPEKAGKLRDDIVQVGINYGFSPEEMNAVTDARYVMALNDARKYRQLVSKRKMAEQKGGKARPVVKAGSRKSPENASATRSKMQQKLKKSGNIEDALNLMIKS